MTQFKIAESVKVKGGREQCRIYLSIGGWGGTNGFKKTHRLLEGHMIFHAGQSTHNRKAEKIVTEIEVIDDTIFTQCVASVFFQLSRTVND